MNPILKELDIKEWELQDPDFKKFYQWLDKNITVDNIFTDEDQQSYDAIPLDQRLEGAALQYEMDRIETKYPGIMDVTPELVIRKTEEVAQLAEIQAVYQTIADDLRKHAQQLENDIVETSNAVWKEEAFLKKLGQESNQRVTEIEEIQKSNINMMTEMAKLMQNDNGTEPTFVHQLDLKDYYYRIEMFGQFMDQFMRTHFKTEEHSNIPIEEENEKDTERLEMIKETLWMSWKQCIEAECKVYAQRCVLAMIKKQIKPMSMVSIEAQLAELREINRQGEKKLELQLSALEFALRKEADGSVDLIIQEYTQGKVDQARYRVERFEKANSLLTEQLILTDILWIMANTDFDRLEWFVKLSVFEQYESEALACCKRTDLMRQTAFDETNDRFWHQLHEAVGSPNDDCVEYFVKLYRSMHAILNQLKIESYADDIDEVKDNIGFKGEKLQKLLYDGIIKGPVYKDQLLTNKSHSAKAKLSSFNAELNKIRSHYVSEYVRPMNEDKFFNAKQNLWIWFLTQPQEVQKVLASLKAAAAKAKNPEPKQIAGIRRRNQ